MPEPTTDQKVNEAADQIENAAKDTNSTSTKMLDEVNKTLISQGLSGTDQSTRQLTQKLENDNILPKLLLAEFDNENALKQFGDGKTFDVDKLKATVNGTGTPAEKMLAQAFLDHLQLIALAGDTDPTVTKNDLEAWAKGADRSTGSLSKENIEKTADELHEAIFQRTILHTDDPDKDKIQRLLDPLNQADRAAIEKAYHDKFDKDGNSDTLRRDLKSKLGGDNGLDWRKTEAVLNRDDGRTNDAGALMVALTHLKSDKDKGNAEVIAVFRTLNSADIAKLNADFQKDYGMNVTQALQDSKDLTSTTRDALAILQKGSDKKTTDDVIKLANIALDGKDDRLFAAALSGDTEAAKAARVKLQTDDQFKEKLAKAFPSDKAINMGITWTPTTTRLSFDQAVDQSALDYLNEGLISLATIAANNSNRFMFDNKENIELAARHATEEERKNYAAGRDLVQNKQEPTTDEQRKARDYYNKIHKAFDDAGSDRETAIWEDQLLHGRPTVITALAQSHSDGYGPFNWGSGHNRDDLFKAAENLSENDWNLLRSDKGAAFRKDIEASLRIYTNDEERASIMSMLDQKAAQADYAAANQIHRSLVDNISDNKGHAFLMFGTNYDGKDIIKSLQNINAQDAGNYKNDPTFRKEIDDFVGQHLGHDEQLFARRLLGEVATTGVAPKSDPVDVLLSDRINGAKSAEYLPHIEAIFSDQTLRAYYSQPDDKLSADDKEIKDLLRLMVDNAVVAPPVADGGQVPIGQSSSPYMEELLKSGQFSLKSKAELGYEKPALIEAAVKAKPEEVAQLAGVFSDKEIQLIEQVRKQGGEFKLADRMRMFIVEEKGDYHQFDQDLAKLTPADKEKLKNEYFTKYGGVLNDDFLKLVKGDADKVTYKNYLSPDVSDGRQDYYDNYAKLLQSESGFSLDGSKLTAERASELHANALEEYQRQFQKLPPEQQKAMNEFFGTALEQYKDSKEKLAEVLIDATVTAAALAAAPFTAGLSTAAMFAVIGGAAAAGAAYRVTALKVIEGNDFDGSVDNVVRQAIIGGTTAALNFVGPELFASVGRLAGDVAEAAASSVLSHTAQSTVKEGAEKILADELKTIAARSGAKGLTDDEISMLVSKVAADGANEADLRILGNTIKSIYSKTYTDLEADLVKKLSDPSFIQRMKDLGVEAAQNAAVGGAANAASEPIVSFATGQGFDLNRMVTAGWTGLAVGFVAPITFKGVFKGFEAGAAGYGKLVNAGADTEIVVNAARSATGGVSVAADDNPLLAGILHSDGSRTMFEPGQKYEFRDGDNPIPHTDGQGKVVMGRPVDEVEVKYAKLKQDLKINPWDSVAVQKQKLIADLKDNYRIRVSGNGQNIHIIDGNTRYAFAKKLGISDDDIEVVWKDTQKVSLGDLLNGKIPDGPKPAPELPVLGQDGKYYVHDGEKLVPLQVEATPIATTTSAPSEPTTPKIERVDVNGHSTPVNKVVSIGSDADADIKVGKRSEGISGHQAWMFVDEQGATYIADAGSANGTYIRRANGEVVPVPAPDPAHPDKAWMKVEPGDKVILGKDFSNVDANGDVIGTTKSQELQIKPETGATTDNGIPHSKQNAAITAQSSSPLGEGFEGQVFDNGDGTVTKVFQRNADDPASVRWYDTLDVNDVVSMNEKLEAIGVKVPKIYEHGTTANGQKAIKMEKIGNGDNLQDQLTFNELSPAEMESMRRQYYEIADLLEAQNLRIDWNLKNMTFSNGVLYILDPSFLQEGSMKSIVDFYGQRTYGIGPRPE